MAGATEYIILLAETAGTESEWRYVPVRRFAGDSQDRYANLEVSHMLPQPKEIDMPTEELFGAYHVLDTTAKGDSFQFKPASSAGDDSGHDQWIPILSPGSSTTRPTADTPTEEVAFYYNKIEWTYAETPVEDFAG